MSSATEHPSTRAWTEGEVLQRLADGTVRQINPFTGTEVLTVPGRGNRPLAPAAVPHLRIDPARHGRHCAFCEHRYLETTPEKARLVRTAQGWRRRTGLTAEQVAAEPADFRLFANLFEIVSYDYWRANHGYQPTPAALDHARHYLSTVGGISHVEHLQAVRSGAASGGVPNSDAFFAGLHDVLVARRHHVDGAVCEDELASAGTLTVDEHRAYIGFTIEAMRDLYAASPLVRNVVVFQNWLRPAGASFDHLHKQLVALDTVGWRGQRQAELLAHDPDAYRHRGIELARRHGLVIAENEHAVAFAGIGHRYPAVEVWSRDDRLLPWDLDAAQVEGFADLLRMMHHATGPAVPTNEEWHHRRPTLTARVPLRAVVKWRVNTPAGFEGGSGIHVNTIDPWSVRDRVLARLDSVD